MAASTGRLAAPASSPRDAESAQENWQLINESAGQVDGTPTSGYEMTPEEQEKLAVIQAMPDEEVRLTMVTAVPARHRHQGNVLKVHKACGCPAPTRSCRDEGMVRHDPEMEQVWCVQVKQSRVRGHNPVRPVEQASASIRNYFLLRSAVHFTSSPFHLFTFVIRSHERLTPSASSLICPDRIASSISMGRNCGNNLNGEFMRLRCLHARRRHLTGGARMAIALSARDGARFRSRPAKP
jgi:hypothetical protein